MLIGLVGLALLLWALKMRLKEFDQARPEIFQGPVGHLVNYIMIALGAFVVYWGWIA